METHKTLQVSLNLKTETKSIPVYGFISYNKVMLVMLHLQKNNMGFLPYFQDLEPNSKTLHVLSNNNQEKPK